MKRTKSGGKGARSTIPGREGKGKKAQKTQRKRGPQKGKKWRVSGKNRGGIIGGEPWAGWRGSIKSTQKTVKIHSTCPRTLHRRKRGQRGTRTGFGQKGGEKGNNKMNQTGPGGEVGG